MSTDKKCSHNTPCVGEGVDFLRLRRITGYLSGDYKTRFNDAKRAECEARVTHSLKKAG